MSEKSEKDRRAEMVFRREVGIQWTSPFPPPNVLEAYRGLSPEVLERLLTLIERHAEENLEHARAEREEVARMHRADERQAFVCVWIAFAVAVLLILLCAALAAMGYPKIAGLLCGGEMAAIVGLFIFKRR